MKINEKNQRHKGSRPDGLSRARIREMLRPSAERPLFAVTADAGYGKTTAVSDCVARTNASVIWIAFSEEDNHPVCFWENYTEAVEAVNKEAAAFMRKMGFPSDPCKIHNFYYKLHIAMKGKPCILVFDDVQCIRNQRIEEFLNIVILRRFPNTYAYMISRRELELPITDEKICYVTSEDLRFQTEEIELYFKQKNLHIIHEFAEEIRSRTEGWAFAVYLVSLSVQKNENLLDRLQRFSHQLIFETIEEEIFSAYTAEEQKFILNISLLEPLPLQLADHLYEEELRRYCDRRRADIFVCYNHRRRTYQSHQLLQEFLKTKQDLLSEEEKQETYEQAAQWYGQRGMAKEEIHYFRRAGNYKAVWEAFWKFEPGYYTPCAAAMMMEAVQEFPDDFREQYPMTDIVAAAMNLATGDMEAMREMSEQIIRNMEQKGDSKENQMIIGEAYVNLAFSAWQTGDLQFAEYFKKADQYLEEGSRLYRKPYMFLLNSEPVIMREGSAGELETWVDTLAEAEPWYSRVLGGGLDGMAVLAKAVAHYYRGEIWKAEEYAIQAVYKGKESQQADIICSSYFLLSRIAVFKGEYNLLMECLEEIKWYAGIVDRATQFHMPDVAYGIFFAKIELKKNVPKWIAYEKNRAMTASYYYGMGMERLVKANCMITDGNFYEVIPYLQQTAEIYVKAHKYIYIIHAYVLLAIAYYHLNNMDMTTESFYKCYEMSYQNHIIMIPAVYGKYSRSMIGALLKLRKGKKQVLSDQNERLLQEMDRSWMEACFIKASSFAKRVSLLKTQYMTEHEEAEYRQEMLTEREKQILQALSDGFTREELADYMDLSLNTIKSKLNSIYAKLGAVNSTQAVYLALLKGII